MKKQILFLLIICCLSLVFCCHHDNKKRNSLTPAFKQVLADYISNNPTDSVYSVGFYNIEGRQFFEIVGTGCIYDKDLLDGCFIFKNKIVCYFSVNKGFADSLICNTNKMQCMDMLSKYKEKHENNINDDRHYVPMSYRIISKDSIRVASKSDFVWIKACDTTVIKNNLLNKIINKYINANKGLITYIRFKRIDNVCYFCIGEDFAYDEKDFSGMFYRNGHIVVLYSSNKISNISAFIDTNSLKGIDELRYYRKIHRLFPLYSQDIYRLTSKSFDKITEKDSEWIQLWFNE